MAENYETKNLLTSKRIKKDLSLKIGEEALAYSGVLLLWELILAGVSFALCKIFDTKIVFFHFYSPSHTICIN